METPRGFEITVGGKQITLELGRCAVALFRNQSEVSYVAVQLDEEQTLRIFNNQPFCEFAAGYKIVEQEGVIYRPVTRQLIDGESTTFREFTGWNPAVIEREQPNEYEIEMWLDVNASDIDKQWEAWGA